MVLAPAGEAIKHGGDCYLKWAGKLHRWSHTGYEELDQRELPSPPLSSSPPLPLSSPSPLPSQQAPVMVHVLTPPSLVRCLSAGFQPRTPHPSAHGTVQPKEEKGTAHSAGIGDSASARNSNYSDRNSNGSGNCKSGCTSGTANGGRGSSYGGTFPSSAVDAQSHLTFSSRKTSASRKRPRAAGFDEH